MPLPSHSILDLPDELLIFILKQLGARDAVNLSGTCKRIRQIILGYQTLWKYYLASEFPDATVRIQKRVGPVEFQSVFAQRFAIQNAVVREVREFSTTHFHSDNISRIYAEEFLAAVDFRLVAFTIEDENRAFVLDALTSILHQTRPDRELTHKYYVRKLLHFARYVDLKPYWLRLKAGASERLFNYVEGLVHFAQWFQPQDLVRHEMVELDVQNIAAQVLRNLHIKNTRHPIFELCGNQSLGGVKTMRNFLLKAISPEGGQVFTLSESQDVFEALNKTFYDEMGFVGNSSNYYNPNNSYIDKVLATRHGIPITLCLLYSSVARLLGLNCQPVNNPSHFLLCWKHEASSSCVLIDCFEKGKQIAVDQVSGSFASPLQVFQRLVRNVIYAAELQDGQDLLNLESTGYPLFLPALELQAIIGFDDGYDIFSLCRLYLQLDINHREVIEILDQLKATERGRRVESRMQIRGFRDICMQQLERSSMSERPAPKFRSNFGKAHEEKDLEEFGRYAVGMVMKHKAYNYVCVIYGWDPVCEAGDPWIRRMGVDQLKRKDRQPFYNVLVEDGSIRYASDVNLMPAKPQRISNPLVGKYFMEFDESIGYIANDETSIRYPEDGQVLLQFEGSWKRL